MTKVTIIDFTGSREWDEKARQEYAGRLLAFTKQTRLQMTPEGFEAFLLKPWDEIAPELAYMANTIPSSWEFVDVTFTLQGVSRACAQQLTRTRFTPMETDMFGSYAMQSQRVTDMSEVGVRRPTGMDAVQAEVWDDTVTAAKEGYESALATGIALEDARGLLPMNAECNLVVKFNLRMLAEMFRKRESLRVQGEFVELVRQMRGQVEAIWPWAAPFFVPKDAAAIAIIEGIAAKLPEHDRRELAKAADLIKGV